MRRSIRWRLQLWYALVLLAVVAGFAAILYYRVRAARFREVDAGLQAAAFYLDASLRRSPPVQIERQAVENESASFHGEESERGGHPPDDCPPPFPGEGHGPGGHHHAPPPDGRGPGEGHGPGGRHHPPPPGDGGPGWEPFGRPPSPHGPRPESPPIPVTIKPDLERWLAEVQLPGRPATAGASSGGAYFAVWRSDGSLLKASNLPEGVVPADLPGSTASPAPSLSLRGEHRELALAGPEGTRILVGESVGKELAELRALAWQLAGAGLIVLTLGLAGGWLVSARILQPLAAISATASAISATHLSERIDPEKVDRELAELSGVLNAMFDRLQAAFERQARFTADASHELRTPLAIIRSHAELALARPRTPGEYREAVAACLRASERMTALVEGLLVLARADGGKLDMDTAPVELKRLVEEHLALLGPLAKAKGVFLSASLQPVTVAGDPVRLGQVITNLLSNAIQYNRRGGRVHLRLSLSSGEAFLSVADTGAGIPDEDRPHIFERFYRVDKARSRASGGNGLGLAICKSIVEAHGGTIGFDTKPGRGSNFWVRLPGASSGAA